MMISKLVSKMKLFDCTNFRMFSGCWTQYLKARVSCPAPSFSAMAYIDGGFKKISLSDYAGKYVVLFFYPLDFTFVCPTEICAFNDMAKQFRENNAELIACSVDSWFTHAEYANKPRSAGGLGGMQIPMLSDITKQISADYGVLTPDGAISFRGTFIIDKIGNLRHSSVNDLPVGRSPEETLRLVKAFQHVDKHGEVCPANWQPGKKAMDPDHSSAKTKAYWKNELAK